MCRKMNAKGAMAKEKLTGSVAPICEIVTVRPRSRSSSLAEKAVASRYNPTSAKNSAPPCAAFAPSFTAAIRLARYFGGSNPSEPLVPTSAMRHVAHMPTASREGKPAFRLRSDPAS